MIEDIILRHSQRGMDVLRPYMPKAFCEEAVEPHHRILCSRLCRDRWSSWNGSTCAGFEKIRISARDRNRCFVQGLF